MLSGPEGGDNRLAIREASQVKAADPFDRDDGPADQGSDCGFDRIASTV